LCQHALAQPLSKNVILQEYLNGMCMTAFCHKVHYPASS
jgi:hypothetical protein